MKELNSKGGTNRFKYSSFNDIISTISIDVSHVIKKSKLEEDYYFKQGLIKWKELNASTDFKEFLKEIAPYQSLVQLVHHKKEIVDILIKHLDKGQSLAIEPLVWLSVDLAKDLLQDFFPFYLDFLKSITHLLKSAQDPHLIQNIFTSIAWLFKINSKKLSKEIIPTFDVLVDMLNSKQYIQEFTAESFGFLVRKLDFDQLIELFLRMKQKLEENEENYIHGFGLLIMETIKHVQGNLHSKGLVILKEFWRVFSSNRPIIEKVAGLAPAHLSNDSLCEVFESLVTEIHLHSSDNFYSLFSMFSAANILLLYRNGSYIKDKSFLLSAISVICKDLEVSRLSEGEKHMFLLFFSQSYATFSSVDVFCNLRDSMNFIFSLDPNDTIFCCYILLHSSWKPFHNLLWESLMVYLNKHWENKQSTFARFLGFLFSGKCSFLYEFMPRQKDGLFSIEALSVDLVGRICEKLNSDIFKQDEKALMENELRELVTLVDVLNSFSIAKEKVEESLLRFFIECCHYYMNEGLNSAYDASLLHSLIGKCLSILSFSLQKSAPDGFHSIVRGLININCESSDMILGISAYVKYCPLTSEIFNDFDSFYWLFSNYIYHKDDKVRLNTLQLLSNLEVKNKVEYPVFHHLLEIETTKNSIEEIRNKSSNIRKLEMIYMSQNIKIVQDAIMKYFFALFSVNFTPLWDQASKSLSHVASSHPASFWEVFHEISTSLCLDDKINGDTYDEYDVALFHFDIPFGMRQIDEWRLLHKGAYANNFFKPVEVTRNDCAMYQQLLKIIEKTHSVSGRYAKELVTLFLNHHQNHYSKYRPITFGFLSMLSSIRGLSKFLEIDSELCRILLSMLTCGELKLQELSFDCLLLCNDESLKKNADYLREIIKEDNFFENLSSFDDTNLSATTFFTDIVSRILYGKMISKIGRSSKNIAKSRRKAIFGFLAKFQVFLDPFVNLMNFQFISKNTSKVDRHEIGFLSILEDFIGHLQLFLSTDILVRLCDTLVAIGRQPDFDVEIGVEDDDTEKNIRSLCVKRWKQLFEINFDMNFSRYQTAILENLILHKIKKFASENTQAPSAILLLCAEWAKNPTYSPWLFHETVKDLVPQIVAILSEKKVKDSVISVVLNIIEDLQMQCLDSSSNDNFIGVQYRLIFPNILLHSRNALKASLDSSKLLPYQMRLISIISEASLLGANVTDRLQILEILFPYLKKPSKFFSEKLKIQLMNIFINFSDCIPQNQRIVEHSMHFRTIAQLYLTIESRVARQTLSKVMNVFVLWDPNMMAVSELLDSFNSYSEKRIDEPDFKKQMIAFSLLNNQLLHKLDENQWLPVIYQMLFSLKSQDYATRNSAALSLELFIKMASDSQFLPSDGSNKMHSLVEFVILPTIKNGLKHSPEIVRLEYLRFLGLIVRQFKAWKISEELSPLLGSDEETDFFSNIYHLQLHRRSRAIRCLETVIFEGRISSPTVANIFMPVLNHFILESKGKDHNFTNDVVRVIGACSKSLNWGHYSSYLNQYVQLLQKSIEIEKVIFRSILQIVESFHFKIANDMDGCSEEIKMDIPIVSIYSVQKLVGKLEELFPSNHSDSAARIQIAYALSIIYRQYPIYEGKLKLQKLFSKLSIMLSNHVQDYRDNARDVLAKIVLFWGSKTFPDAVLQLRLHLDRGYKKHILAYTLHWLLVRLIESISPNDIDFVLEEMVNICIDDIFGLTAEEKQVAELKSKFKEIKKSKSLDSLELLAGAISFKSVVVLLLPIKEAMMVIVDNKSIGILRETFRRISIGINSNKSVTVAELFPFIRELLTENLSLSRVNSENKKVSKSESNYLVQMKRPTSKDPLKILASNAYLFIDYGLALLLIFLKKDDSSKICISLLDPFIDILGSLLFSIHDSILTQVLKIWFILFNLRLPKLEAVAPVILKRSIKIVTNSAALDSELSQMALRLLSILIREGHAKSLTQNQVAAILSILKPNLDEPSKQFFVFGIVQSIISSKIICDEVYDIMDEIIRNMIVNQTESIRNVCRLTYIKFILTYPHGQAKLDKLVQVAIKGLEYEFESGRLTILEAINDLIEKFSAPILAEYFEMFFMALILNILNDDSSKCKEVASSVLQSLLKTASNTQLDKLMTMIHAWNENSSNRILQRASIQVYGIIVESCSSKLESWMNDILKRAVKILDDSISVNRVTDTPEGDKDWISLYYAISLLSKAMTHVPGIASKEIPLKSLKKLLLHFHQWVRSVSGKLFGQIFTYFNSVSENVSFNSHHEMKEQLNDGKFMLSLGKTLCSQLDSNGNDEEFSIQIVKNLVFVSKKVIRIGKDTKEGLLLIIMTILARKSRQEASKSKNTLIQSSTLKWFAAISHDISREDMETYLKSVLEIIYRITTDETTKGDDYESLRNLAREAQSHLQTACDPQIYLAIYCQVKETAIQMRNDRKVERSVMAVVDPEKYAKRKAQKNSMKKAQKKRKVEEFSKNKIKNKLSLKRSRIS